MQKAIYKPEKPIAITFKPNLKVMAKTTQLTNGPSLPKFLIGIHAKDNKYEGILAFFSPT
jgi:hypothetical protein